MNHIERAIKKQFFKTMYPGKVQLLLGARRTGKTVFLEEIIKELKTIPLVLDGDDLKSHDLLRERSIENYTRLLEGQKVIIIDEAQKIPDIGNKLKLIVDHIKEIIVIVTGSSAFDLYNQLGEPLTGRKITYQMFPLAQMEYAKYETPLETASRLEERLIYGSYPELLQYKTLAEKANYMNELISSYLLKDILAFENIRNSEKLIDLLRLLAFQIGKQVSLEELGKQLQISRNTVERYLDLLSKVFVIYQIRGFSRNLRKEITKTGKWYFYDNGIRNALIANFNPIATRNDIGELWENYLLSERLKFQSYTGMISNNYFWRTYDQQEIDWIEDRGGKLYAFEIKWNTNKKTKAPSGWVEGYPKESFQVITRENYLDWIK